MIIKADCHVHSNTSPDAVDSIDSLCQAAIDRGLEHICFTNHHEIFPGDPTPREFLLDFEAYHREIETARDKYSDRLEILKGVEFGGPQQHPREYEELQKKELDMILVSLHFLPLDYGIHWLWCGADMMLAEGGRYFVQRYYDEMRRLTAIGGFQVLGHLDWPKCNNPYFQEIQQLDAEILTNLINHGAVPEINTKAYVKGCSEFYPAPRFLEQYAALGGKNLTVGSDAHSKEEVAGYFGKAEDFLKLHDFEVGYFKEKKFVPLKG